MSLRSQGESAAAAAATVEEAATEEVNKKGTTVTCTNWYNGFSVEEYNGVILLPNQLAMKQ